MKCFIHMLLLLGVVTLNAQGELTAVSIEVAMEDSVLRVRQTFALSLTDSVSSFEIKALQFEGTKLDFLAASLKGEALGITYIPERGMERLKLRKEVGKPWSEVVCTYKVKVTDQQFYLPLFFTNFSAATSENDFCRLKLRMPQTENYRLLFPTVKWEESLNQTDKVVSLEVPALPAFLRLKRLDGNQGAFSLNDTVDLLAVFLFLGIGVLVWINRKRLSYG